jgi:ubiquinone/menaquinone biosynthesis C-methylase UbiE
MVDLPFLSDWAQKQGGTIIDLACGTGRITIPLAEKGFTMIGVDLNEGMLNRAIFKTKNRFLPIDWELQDCTKLSLDSLSRFIYMTGNSFQHFLTNDSQNKLLQSVYSHLDGEGVFIFNTRFPVLSELAVKDERREVYVDKRNRKVVDYHTEQYHALTQVLECIFTREIYNEKGEMVGIEKDAIFLRYVFPMEMERLLVENNFTILHVYGTWGKDALQENSPEMIYVCKKVG